MSFTEYPEAVLEYVQAQGWTTNTTELREGAYIVAGSRETVTGTERQLLMIVCDPESEVTINHLEYLLKAGRKKDVSSVLLTYSVTITEEAQELCEEYNVEVIDSEKVHSHTDSSEFSVGAGEISIPNSNSDPQVSTESSAQSNQMSAQKNDNPGNKSDSSSTSSESTQTLSTYATIGGVIGGVIGLFSILFPYASTTESSQTEYGLFSIFELIEAEGVVFLAWVFLISIPLGSVFAISAVFHDNEKILEWGGLLQGFGGITILIIAEYNSGYPATGTVEMLLGNFAITNMNSEFGFYLLLTGAFITVMSYDYFQEGRII